MSRIDLDAALKSLSPDQDRAADRRESAMLVDLIDSIDDAIARGVPRATVLSRLHESGFTMTLPTFIKALQRIRKRLGRPAPRRRNQPRVSSPLTGQGASVAPPTTPASTSALLPPAESPQTPPVAAPPTGRTIRSREEIRRENPTLSSVQISKLVAQQYADPVITSEQLEEMKRKYNPPQIKP